MISRCVLFSSDSEAIDPIRQALASLAVEGEFCSDAVAAVEKVCKESFQIVIVDWDRQPEAGTLLQAVRERKATERPLTLAIVSDDSAVPKALQAGATSVLRKPIQLKQVTDSLSRARDLLKARESAAQAAAAGVSAAPAASASASPVPSLPASPATNLATNPYANLKTTPQANPTAHPVPNTAANMTANMPTRDATLRAGEFLGSGTPATQFDTESEMQKSMEQAAAQEVEALKDLEPTASAVAQNDVQNDLAKHALKDPLSDTQKFSLKNGAGQVATDPAPDPPQAAPKEPRGLQWYLDQKTGRVPFKPAAELPASSSGAAQGKPELLGFDQNPSQWKSAESAPAAESKDQEKKAAELFAYIAGENDEAEKDERPRRRLGKGAILFAVALAACAIVAAPQAPWHPRLRALWARGQKSLHAWLNPQPVTPVQAPVSHESFSRAGDEYKLPAAENIPDATTDPSQIRVTPMVDPTAKKPNTGADPNLAPADASGGTPQSPGMQNATPDGQANGQGSSAGQGNGGVSNSGAGNPGADGATPGNPPPQPPAQPVSVAPTNVQPANSPSGGAQPGSNASSTPSVNNPATSTAVSAAPSSSTVARPVAAPSGNVSTTNASIPSSLKSQLGSMTPEASGNKPPETALPTIEPVALPEAAERALVADQPAIAYPASAKGQQGIVILQVLIDRDGAVQDAKFLQGSLAFARTAIDGVKQWKFKPYIMNGRPVSVQTNLTIGFKPQ